MRAASFHVFVLGLGTLACKIDNPGFFVTEGLDGSGSGASGDASTTGRTTTDATTDDTTRGPTSTSTPPPTSSTDPSTTSTTDDPSTTVPVTTDPQTSGTSSDTDGDTSTGDVSSSTDGSTSMVDMCALPVAPPFDLGFATTDPNFACNPGAMELFHAQPVTQEGPGIWTMRVCKFVNECKTNMPCTSDKKVTLRFDTPVEFVPKLDHTPCHQVSVLVRGPDQNNGDTCRLSVMRLAHAGFDTYAEEYVGAVDVTDTGALPLGWPDILGFGVIAEKDVLCDGEPACKGVLPGQYSLKLDWKAKQKFYGIPEGGSVAESFSVKKGGQPLDILGSFTNLASHAHPGGTCEDGHEFAWVWFSELVAP